MISFLDDQIISSKSYLLQTLDQTLKRGIIKVHEIGNIQLQPHPEIKIVILRILTFRSCHDSSQCDIPRFLYSEIPQSIDSTLLFIRIFVVMIRVIVLDFKFHDLLFRLDSFLKIDFLLLFLFLTLFVSFIRFRERWIFLVGQGLRTFRFAITSRDINRLFK